MGKARFLHARRAMAAAVLADLWLAGPAYAQETVTYSYDALGRVTVVQHSGGPANGTSANYTYDPASNRSNVTVTGSPNGSGGSNSNADNGASVPATTIYVVVPLNGYTLIPITR